MLYKSIDIDPKSVKQQEINGVKVGKISGFASTTSKDRGGDIILPFAFRDKLSELAAIGDPVIPMFLHHDPGLTIGVYPINLMRHDEKGLFVEGHINLEMEKGRETFTLSKQGAFKFSVGFNPIKSKPVDEKEGHEEGGFFNRTPLIISEGELMEITLTPIPMQMEALMTEVKGATTFKDLPLASFERAWDSSAADARVREKTNSVESPSRAYRGAFFWFDSAESDKFGSYKLPFVDVIDGELKAVPRGIFAAAGALGGARGGVDIPASDRPKVITHVNRYYTKMDRESPLDKDADGDNDKSKSSDQPKSFKKDIEALETVKDFENYLKDHGHSSRESTNLTYRIKKILKDNEADSLSELKELKAQVIRSELSALEQLQNSSLNDLKQIKINMDAISVK